MRLFLDQMFRVELAAQLVPSATMSCGRNKPD